MSDERPKPDDERDADEEHPLESPDSLREPRDERGDEDRAPQSGLTTELDDR